MRTGAHTLSMFNLAREMLIIYLSTKTLHFVTLHHKPHKPITSQYYFHHYASKSRIRFHHVHQHRKVPTTQFHDQWRTRQTTKISSKAFHGVTTSSVRQGSLQPIYGSHDDRDLRGRSSPRNHEQPTTKTTRTNKATKKRLL